MNKFLTTIIATAIFVTSVEAARVRLTEYDDNTYFMEITKWDYRDTATSLLKDIAKEVRKKGYKIFLMPPNDQASGNSCYIILSNKEKEEIKSLANAYGYRTWVVEDILKG
jgi:hypothetical protein